MWRRALLCTYPCPPILPLFASPSPALARASQTCSAATLRAFVTWFVHPNSQTNVQTDAETNVGRTDNHRPHRERRRRRYGPLSPPPSFSPSQLRLRDPLPLPSSTVEPAQSLADPRLFLARVLGATRRLFVRGNCTWQQRGREAESYILIRWPPAREFKIPILGFRSQSFHIR